MPLSARCKLITSKATLTHTHTHTGWGREREIRLQTDIRTLKCQQAIDARRARLPRYPSRHLSLLSAKQQWPLNYVWARPFVCDSLSVSVCECICGCVLASVCLGRQQTRVCLTLLLWSRHLLARLANSASFELSCSLCLLASSHFDSTLDAIIRTHIPKHISHIYRSILPKCPCDSCRPCRRPTGC